MIFQSVEYLIFFTLLLCVYFWLPRKGQNLLLVVASYIFYGWIHHWYVLLIGITTLFDWGCAIGMEKSTSDKQRKAYFILSISVNLAILFAFKYFGFFIENVTAVLTAIGLMPSPILLKIALPAGISFFTFQSLSYAIDVYRKQLPACRSLLDYATFAAFFPQLVAGPIERAGHMLPQYQVVRRPQLEAIRSGFVLILWGLFQKLAIADSTAMLANKVFALADASFPVLWGGVLAFGVQIYADFSGYTAIARGSARIIGIELCPNFNHPYISQSPSEFWRRWHMSLGKWFKDYIFIPLGGSRVSSSTTIRNVMFVFFLSGLWHGAGWNFIFWGLFHGLLLSIWPYLSKAVPLFGKAGGPAGIVFRVVFTFAIMHVGRVLFREHNLAMIVHHLTLNPLAATLTEWRIGCGIGLEAVLYGLPLTLIFPLVEYLGWIPSPEDERLKTWKWTLIQSFAAGLILLGIVALCSTEGGDFIYFQF
ncbi:MAG: MBOAT family protein [Verrucomicrobiaceae bacterium]|nr:MBOAT family protein [Verrucomicrobiaceae bacterium]